MSKLAVYYHPVFLKHETGEHPERAERLVVTRKVLQESSLPLEWITPEEASVEAVARVHDPTYIDLVRQTAADGGGWLDWDTAISPRSYEAAMLAAGAGIQAVERALAEGEKSLLLVRPPGHHARRSRGMGFCLFNNIAVAAAHALNELGQERILVVDWDVHHGNGTQESFYGDPRVLFCSLHQTAHFPGTGFAEEVGREDGAGYTVNVPLRAGDGDAAVRLAFDSLILPLARAYKPQLILVSAGYDGERGDPLGGLNFSRSAFRWMAGTLRELAEELGAAGPVCFLEGGYVPAMLAASVKATLEGLAGDEGEFSPVPTAQEREDVEATLMALRPYWPGVL